MTTSAVKNRNTSTPIWLKIIAGNGVVWYLFGLMQFWLGFSMDTEAAIASGEVTAAHGAAIVGTPMVIWIAFAIASGAGVMGAALLLVGSPASATVFAVSLISAAVYYVWVYALSGTGSDRPSEEIIIAAVVVTITLAFLLLSRRMTR